MHQVEDPIALLKAVSEPNRLRALYMLSKMEINVTDLAAKLDLTHNLLSFHLKKLISVGILGKRRDGNQFFYFIKPDWHERVDFFFKFVKID